MPSLKDIRLVYEQDREQALRILRDAGVEFRDVLEETEPSLGDFRDLAVQGLRTLASAIDASLTSSLERMVGGGTINQSVINLMDQAGKAAGTSIGGDGLWGQLLSQLTSFIGRAGLRVASAEVEMLRMAGAKALPTITAGHVEGGEDLKEKGRTYRAMVNEIRSYTGESEGAIEALAAELAKLGIRFDETSGKATAYALSADKLYNLTKGATQELITSSIQQYGQSWEDTAIVISDVTQASSYWKEVADKTDSTIARALSSNDNLIKMYSRMRDATKGTAFEMTGLNKLFLATTEGLRQLGIARTEMISSATAEFLSKMAPQTTDFVSTVMQGAFLREVVTMSEKGREFWAGVDDIRKQRDLDPLLSNIALSQYLVKNPQATGQFGALFLENLATTRDAIGGSDRQSKNTVMINRLVMQMGVSTGTAGLVLALSDAFRDLRKSGASEHDAFAKLKQTDLARSVERETGKPIEETLVQWGGLGQQTLSAAEQLALAAEKMAILDGQTFWPAWSNVVKSARTAEQMGLSQSPTLANLFTGEMPLGEERESSGGKIPTPRQMARQEPEKRKERAYPVGSWTTSSAGGVEIKTLTATADDPAVVKRYRPGSAAARDLFTEAARLAGVPESWAQSPALHKLLEKESGGVVGRPNYTYGRRAKDPRRWGEVHAELKGGKKTAESSATGLGQLLLSNVEKYYPSGKAGIGNPLEEAAGMMGYIAGKYGTPEAALAQYGMVHEGY